MTHHIEAPPRWIARNRSRDHPRSRGVYFAGQVAINPPRGSSPLARGLQLRLATHAVPSGIIPARAGFTRPLEALTRSSQDHPRSRGVYSRPLRALISIQGSSPLARGLLGATREGQKVVRIIPARAGFTDVSPDLMIESADHPRSRGVYQQYVLLIHWNRGSSPLARGLRIACERLRIGIGIIPARAGFTPGSGRPLRHQGDHPRSRGVYRRATGLPPAPHGSSPLARGLRALGFHPDSWVRIIPARAGFTKLDLVKILVVVDHPRSRGVYESNRPSRPSGRGSSPLARGLR